MQEQSREQLPMMVSSGDRGTHRTSKPIKPHQNKTEAVFLVGLGMSSFPVRNEVYGKTL